MQKYKLEMDVPWRDILGSLRWRLECHIQSYRRMEKFFEQNQEMQKGSLHTIAQSYQNYHALRSFLGYRIPTKIEQEAKALLSGRDMI